MSLQPLPSKPLALDTPALVIHAEPAWHDHVAAGENEYFRKIIEKAQTEGWPTYLVPSESRASRQAIHWPRPIIHLVIGPKRYRGPNIFHAQPSYLPGYWYLDPQGYYWNSSLAIAPFPEKDIKPNAALPMFRHLRRTLVGRNQSKRPQPDTTSLAPAAAAIFTQDIEKYPTPVHYLDTEQMIDAAAKATGGKPIYLKMHPLYSKSRRAEVQAMANRHTQITVTEASVHDIIAASDAVICQNSAVGFEALLHRKPVLTCAANDFHHATLTCQTAKDVAQQLSIAPNHAETFPFAKYVYWFMSQNMLRPGDEDFAVRAWTRLTQ